MKNFFKLVLIFLLIPFSSYSQRDIVIGQSLEFESQILNKKELIQVFLPDGFTANTSKKYPVIYLFDGNQLFHQVTGVVKTLMKSQKIPATIVVGVNPDRFYRSSKDNIELYLKFIDRELQKFIRDKYNSTTYNIVIANSFNGQIALYEMVMAKNLFQSYILSSPYFSSPDYLYETELFLNNQKSLDKNLFISVGFEYELKVDKIFKLTRLLNRAPLKDFYWEYNYYDEKNMDVILSNTIFESLPKIFKDLELPQISGSSDVEEKYQNRKELLDKYGYDFLNIRSAPKSASRELLNLILLNKELSKSVISNYMNDPYYFIDDVELSNLVNYLISINKRKEAKSLKSLISQKVNKEFINNYSSEIELERGLIVDLTFDKDEMKNHANKVDCINVIPARGVDNRDSSAIKFSARDGAVKIKYQDEVDPVKSVSLSCWICPKSINPADSWAISFKPGNPGPHWNTTIGMYPDQWGFEIYSIGRVVYLVRDTIPLNTWTHIVIVADQTLGHITFYKNGEKILERDDLIPFANSTEFLQIGNDLHSFDGDIDEFRLYQRVLSESEVEELFQSKNSVTRTFTE